MLVLIVEDDDRVAQFLHRGLHEEGMIVDRCSTGQNAIQQGVSQPYEIVLLDWALPDMDGISVLRKWRELGMTAPVIMLTARSGVAATVLALDAGADDYLPKPFSFEELLARMKAHARRNDVSGTATSVKIGHVSVDIRRRLVINTEGETLLTTREFQLLDSLLKHRGEVLGRGRILDRVWQIAHDPTTNLVDVYVRYLRSKLDDRDCSESVIETIRGKGYRLRLENEIEKS